MRTKIIVPAEGHVLTLAELRRQCEIVAIDVDSDGNETHPDDDLLLAYLDAAVEYAENFTGRAISLKTYEAALSSYPCSYQSAIDIPHPPLVELMAFTGSEDSDGAIDPETYTLDDYGQWSRLIAVSTWPLGGTPVTNGIKIRFRAGYSAEDSDARPLPAAIRQALLLTVADWYQNREDSVDGQISSLPNGAMALLRPLRVRLGMA